MSLKPKYDVVILGAGHNGLVAAGLPGAGGLKCAAPREEEFSKFGNQELRKAKPLESI